jgi:hypothetical protein
MIDLLPRVKAHFNTTQSRLACFCELGFQTEGWFKGELLYLFSQLHRQGVIQELDREVNVEGKKVDIRLRVNNEDHWIELKHWLIGKQKGTTYNPSFYFGDRTSVGITGDVNKLASLTGHRWLLLLLTANPGMNAWEAGVEKFNIRFAPIRLESRTQPQMFPSTYFLGLLDPGLKVEP